MKNVLSLKRFLCLGIALGAFAAAGPALADPPSGNWSGPYVGAFFGGTWSEFTNNSAPGGPSGISDNITGGGDIGNNWQMGHIVLGTEGDFSKFNNSSGSDGVKFTEDWMSTVRGRAGYALDNFLPYATGGLALTDTVSKVSGVGSSENVDPGYALGGGLDTHLSTQWIGRVEYLYTEVPRDSATIGGTTVDGGSGNHTVRVGVNYLF